MISDFLAQILLISDFIGTPSETHILWFKLKNFIHLHVASDYFSHLLKVFINMLITENGYRTFIVPVVSLIGKFNKIQLLFQVCIKYS